MKYLPILLVCLLAACGPQAEPKVVQQAPVEEPVQVGEDGCAVSTSSHLKTEHVVGPIRNLVKETMIEGATGVCSVEFDIDVNGKTYHLEGTESGYEQLASLCYYARERARSDLLLDLGGEFQSESKVTCRH